MDQNATALPNDAHITVLALKHVVQDFCEARDWDQYHSAKDLAIGIITEAAELLEHFRFQNTTQIEAQFRDPNERTAIVAEVADVMIFLLRFAQRFDIDLSQAVHDKLIDNDRRYPVAMAHGSNRKAQR
jgi:NTP pyrophosphatase (non-canonical NTP hydrolase)